VAEEYTILHPFDVIDPPSQTTPEQGQSAYNDSFANLQTVQIGLGNKALYADQSGIWLGSSKFATAPFSVDMQGNMVGTSVTLSNYLTKTGAAQGLTGSINLGVGNVVVDGTNKRILVNDGTNDRCLLGFQSGGF
jgi:hypothetical protein